MLLLEITKMKLCWWFLINNKLYENTTECLTLKLSDSVIACQYHQPAVQEIVAAVYTVRFLPFWNPVMEGMITTYTLSTVLTNFIHSIFKPGPNVIIRSKVKIMDKDQNNYNTQLSDIHLAPSL
jgi:hypothetical protein